MAFVEPILFTHRGISGPAVLQISSYWQPGDEVEIDLLPNISLSDTLKSLRDSNPKQGVERALSEHMTKRLAQTLTVMWELQAEVGQLSNARIDEIAEHFHHWRVKPSGTEGYRTAEVTIGGIDTNEVSQKTFESKKAPGLYFIGESLDVTGHLGGHNFQWAWASGFCCGESV